MNTTAILAWVKSHVVIVICGALIVLFLPLGWFFSTRWYNGILDERRQELEEQRSQLTQASSVTYVVPPLLPTETAIEHQGAPNAALTAFFQRVRASRGAQVDTVLESAIRFNRGGDRPFSPLIIGLFPQPDASDPTQERRLTIQMARTLLGDSRGQEPAYRTLFEQIGAGTPPAADEVRVTLARVRELAAARQAAAAEGEAGGAEAAVEQAMREARIAQYAQRARELSFYAEPQAVLGQGLRLPPSTNGIFTVDEAFGWQMDYWLVELVLRAVDRANTSASGLAGGVPENAVKRVVSIDAQPPESFGGSGGGASGFGDGFSVGYPDPGAGGGAGAAATTHTGRGSIGADAPFIIREVAVELIVSSDDLVRVVEAFERSNFTTVTGVQATNVDVWQELSQGFFYGEEHVLRVRLTLETVWLDAWLAEYAPPAARERLGIPEPPPAEDPAAASPDQTS